MVNQPSKTAQTRRERLEEREHAIIAAAHDEFIEHGFAGARMADIAKQAGVAEGTVYLYFKNKSALLLAVVGRFYERLTTGAAEGIAKIDCVYERLEFIARHHIESCLAEWRILELVMAQYRHLADYESEGPYQYNKTYVAVFDSVIRDAFNRGEARRDIPLHIIRDLFFGALEYSTRTHILRKASSDDVDVIVDNVMSILRRGIGVDTTSRKKARDLEGVIDRLDTVASRLELATR